MKWFDFYGLINVGISYMYTSLMDPMGNGVIFLLEALIQQSSCKNWLCTGKLKAFDPKNGGLEQMIFLFNRVIFWLHVNSPGCT